MSGSTIGGAVGFVVGAWFGNPQAGYMIGAAIGGYVDPDVIKGPKLTDAQLQTSTEGVPRPIIYGTGVCAGNLIQRGELIHRTHRERQGKGGPVVETDRVYMTYAIRICEAAPLGGENRLRRVWRDDKLVYSAVASDALDADAAAFRSKLRFFSGSESQLPSPDLEALPAANGGGVGNVPAHRGTCYAVIVMDDLTDRRGTIPQYRWEISSDAVVGSSVLDVGALMYAEDVFPWATSAHTLRDPRKAGVTYDYGWVDQGVDYATAHYGYSSPEAAIDAAIASGITGGRLHAGLTLRGWTTWNTIDGDTWQGAPTAIYPWAGTVFDANTLAAVGLVYSRYPAEDEQAGFDLSQSAITGPQFAEGKWLYRPTGDQAGGKHTGVWAYMPEGGAGVDDGFANWNGDDGLSGGSDAIRYFSDFTVVCRPVADCSNDVPSDWVELPDQPGFYIDADNDVQAGEVCTEIAGSFRQLALEGTAGATDPTFTSLPQGPVLEVGDPDDTEAFWAAAYAAAVTAGTMAAGKTYNAAGDGGINTYPRNTTAACQCSDPSIPEVTPNTVVLADIVEDLCDRVGIESTQLDLSQLSDPVRGFMVGRQMAAADAIRALQMGFFFDFPEWDLKLRGIKRGGESLWTITDDDFVLSDEDQDTRLQAVEFPRKINLIVPDPEAGYEPAKQTAERRTNNVKAIGEQTMELPIVFTRDEAAQIADKMLKTAWEEATGRWERELPEEFTGICPSDPLTHDGKRWRVVKTEVFDGSIKVEAVRDRVSATISAASGTVGVSPTAPVSSMRGPTVFVAMNLPSLRTADNTPGMYLAATGRLDGWLGADIFLSVDGGLTETFVTRITSRARMGVLTADVTPSGEPIAVRMYSGDLESVTPEQLALRANAFSIQGDDRVSEIGQFQTATEIDDDDFQLTDTVRGQLGTSAQSHQAGDSFVMLEDAVFVPIDVSLAGKPLIFRAVSIGTVLENNATFTVTYNPQFTAQTVDFYTDINGNRYFNASGQPYYRIN